jgi:hypothetical protein
VLALVIVHDRHDQGTFTRAFRVASVQRCYRQAGDEDYAHPRKEKGVGIAEAKKQLARLVSDIAEGKNGANVDPAGKLTLAMLLDEWIAHGETRGRSPDTLHGYRSKAAHIKAGPRGGIEASKLTTRDLDRWYNALLAGGMSTATLMPPPVHPPEPCR